MWSWKLLGDLEPEELKFECERANLLSSDKVSHNCIKLSKYILSNGYDPETFYFNTHYKADKTNPLMGMSAPAGHFGAVPLPSSKVSPDNIATSSSSSPKHVAANASMTNRSPSDEMIKSILRFLKQVASDVTQLLILKKQENQPITFPHTQSGMSQPYNSRAI